MFYLNNHTIVECGKSTHLQIKRNLQQYNILPNSLVLTISGWSLLSKVTTFQVDVKYTLHGFNSFADWCLLMAA